MPPLGGTMTAVVSTESAVLDVAATPYNEVLKPAPSLRTQNTCETTLLTNTSSCGSTSTSAGGDTVTDSNNIATTVVVDTSIEIATSSSNMDSPEPNQQPRRNLTKAFDALCITTATTPREMDETSKEEKVDVFEDRRILSKLMVSPISVVPTTTSTTRETTSLQTDAAAMVDVVQEGRNHAPFMETLLPSSTAPVVATSTTWSVPDLKLHADLRLKLSLYTVERVSCYSIVHDINKEAAAMALHDPLLQQQQSLLVDTESISPLVTEGRGCGPAPPLPVTNAKATTAVPSAHVACGIESPNVGDHALIDEEKWLLSSIANRSSQETATNTSTKCPATFLQAMGEKEYDLVPTTATTTVNNISANTTITAVTRTQLWKPSRSWWEAKSGKNPWIEPSSHNKRWRYLWPLIHYHKFVHKCIKKLKRNGVDVKTSVSPVSVFLREEVCAVSDHLATVSLFGSEEWMECLVHFNGWTDISSNESILQYQQFVQSLPLRSLQEPVDVDSPLLRNQIDEAFLRTIALQRDSTNSMYHPQNNTPSVASTKVTRNQPGTTTANTSATGGTTTNGGPPPIYPHAMSHVHHLYQHNPLPVPRQINGVRRSRYLPNGWYPGHVHPGWENLPIDASSVHSELSANSYPQPAPHHHTYIDTATVAAQAAHYHMYPLSETAMYYPHPHAVPSGGQSATTMGPGAPSETSHSTGYTYPGQYGGWMDPATMTAFAMHHAQYYPSPAHYYEVADPSSSVYSIPPVETSVNVAEDEPQPDSSESETEANENIGETPYKYNMDQSYMMQSPNWTHLDQATLAMGLATPASTPRRTTLVSDGTIANSSTTAKHSTQLLQTNSVTEDETSITMTETDDEYPITETNPYAVGPIYPGQRQSTCGSNTTVSHLNYYSTLDHSVTSATGRNGVGGVAVPPSPATQFMMSPQASFAYNYGYGVSPARIISSTARGGSSGNSRQRYSSSAGLSSTKHTLDESSRKSTPIIDKNSTTVDAIDVSTSTN